MNWTCLVYFGLILLTTIWFVVDARRWYVGPRTNISEEDIVYGEKLKMREMKYLMLLTVKS